MTDVQRWRQTIPFARHYAGDSTSSDGQADAQDNTLTQAIALSTPVIPGQPKNRVRPRSKFSSYLSTPRTSLAPNTPDCSTSHWRESIGKDKVYKPDPEQMCSTILAHLLTDPTKGLPAQYNGLLLHIVESHRQLTIDTRIRHDELAAEIESHQADVEQFQQAVASWSSEKERYVLSLAALEAIVAKCRNGMTSLVGKQHEGALTNVPPERPHRRSERRTTREATLATDNTTPRLPLNARPSLPSLKTSYLSGDRYAGESREDAKLPLASPLSSRFPDSDLSSTEGDLLSDEEEQILTSALRKSALNDNLKIAVRLTKWLARCTGRSQEDVFNEIVGLFLGRSFANTPRVRALNLKPLPCIPKTDNDSDLMKDVTAPTQPLDSKENEQETKSTRGHRREFSFRPGDDAKNRIPILATNVKPVLSQLNARNDETAFPQDHLDDRLDFQEWIDRQSSSTKGSLRFETTSTPCTQDTLPIKADSPRKPHRDDSGRSVLTVIRNGPGKRLSSSTKLSVEAHDDGDTS